MRPNKIAAAFTFIMFMLYSFVGLLSGAAVAKLGARLPRSRSPPRQRRTSKSLQESGTDNAAVLDELETKLGDQFKRGERHRRGAFSAKTQVRNQVKRIIKEQLDVNESDVKDNANLIDDLGADSLAIVEVVLAMEESFECDIPDEEAEKLKTVGNFVDYIYGHCNR